MPVPPKKWNEETVLIHFFDAILASRGLTLLTAFLSGAIAVFAFAPFYRWPVALVSLFFLFTLWQRGEGLKHRAAIGFAWGMGLFLAGASWLYVALHTYGGMPAPLAALAIFLFCCYLSVFPMLAGVAFHKLHRTDQPIISLLLVMPACFVAGEYVRGWFFSGFPWLIVGYSQTPGDGGIPAALVGFAPIVGVFGISWLLAMTAGALVLLTDSLTNATPSDRLKWVIWSSVMAIWVGGFALSAISWSTPSGAPLSVALVQGNIAQDLKWREEQYGQTRNQYFQLVKDVKAKLIVLPETAEVTFLDEIPPDYLDALKSRAEKNSGDLIMGAPIVERDAGGNLLRYANAAVSMGISPPQRYDKYHLVAFGEFIPPMLSWVYNWLNIPLAGFTPGPTTQAPMRVSGHSVAVNICYEDTFGAEIARPLPEAELLVNIANMAWYGRSLAASQHAQFSQMRALETSRWMLRSTNTGLTAAINEKGEIIKSLPQFVAGVLEADAIPRQGVTPYVRWRDSPVLIGLGLALMAALFIRRRKATP